MEKLEKVNKLPRPKSRGLLGTWFSLKCGFAARTAVGMEDLGSEYSETKNIALGDDHWTVNCANVTPGQGSPLCKELFYKPRRFEAKPR